MGIDYATLYYIIILENKDAEWEIRNTVVRFQFSRLEVVMTQGSWQSGREAEGLNSQVLILISIT